MNPTQTARELLRLAKDADKLIVFKEDSFEDHEYECPMCESEGRIDSSRIGEFDTEYAASVQVYGIGDSLTNLENFVLACSPHVITTLMERLIRLEEALEEIEKNGCGSEECEASLLAEEALKGTNNG